MKFVSKLLHAFFATLYLSEVDLLENGLARKPPMGWMSWGYYECNVNCTKTPDKCLNETLIMSVADHIFEDGYYEAGYEYIVIDDCWSEMSRSEEGLLVPDRKRFPRGMRFLADYIHQRGLKFGMYTNVAEKTCKGYPGSLNHLQLDAQTFAKWHIDYLKVDGCFVGEDVLNTAYVNLGIELALTERPIVYSCSWPYYIEFIVKDVPDYYMVSRYCNLYRNYHDMFPFWGNVYHTIKYYEENYKQMQSYHGPGHWFDPDMLMLGVGALTPSESRLHIVVWAMLSAPLMISCDMKKIPRHDRDLMLNMDLLAIAQDPLGKMAEPLVILKDITIWKKIQEPFKGDQYPSYSFAFVNKGQIEYAVSFCPADHGLNNTDGYSLLDVLAQKYIRNMSLTDFVDLSIPAAGMYKILSETNSEGVRTR